jgi:hypothetical protein
MLRSESLLGDRERALGERLCFCIASLIQVERGQVVEAGADVPISGSRSFSRMANTSAKAVPARG